MVIWMCPYFVLVCICMYECMCGLHVCSIVHIWIHTCRDRGACQSPPPLLFAFFPWDRDLHWTWNQMGTSKPRRHSSWSLPNTALGLQTPILRFLCGSEDSEPYTYKDSGPFTCIPRTTLSSSDRLGSACQCLLAFRFMLCCLSLVLWHVPGVSTVTVRTEGKPHYVHNGQ